MTKSKKPIKLNENFPITHVQIIKFIIKYIIKTSFSFCGLIKFNASANKH